MKTKTQTRNKTAYWISGMATAMTATASGAVVQIDLVNNFMTLGSGDNLILRRQRKVATYKK